MRGDEKLNDTTEWCEEHGITLMERFTGVTKDLKWRCGEGHEFIATIKTLKSRQDYTCIGCMYNDEVKNQNLVLD